MHYSNRVIGKFTIGLGKDKSNLGCDHVFLQVASNDTNSVYLRFDDMDDLDDLGYVVECLKKKLIYLQS